MADYTTTFSNLNTLLQGLPANMVDTPYSINITGLTTSNIGEFDDSGTLGYILHNNRTKYVDLSETELPGNLTSLSWTFANCSGIVIPPEIPSTVTNMERAFFQCYALKEAPELPSGVTNVKTIFGGCWALEKGPDIPSAITNISDIFEDCSSLKEVTLHIEDYTDVSVSYAFYGCDSLEKIYVPNETARTTLMNKLGSNDFPSTLDKNTIIKLIPEPPDPSTFEKGNIQSSKSLETSPYTLSATQTISSDIDRKFILNSSSATITLADSNVVGITISIMPIQSGATINYKNSSGVLSTETCEEFKLLNFIWNGTYWNHSDAATAITGIDDDGQPFAYNIDSLVEPGGVINISGVDANGNPFDYGVGRLVTNANEDNIVTGVEIKTSRTFNGKPVYIQVKEWTGSIGDQTNVYIFDFLNVDKILKYEPIYKNNTGAVYGLSGGAYIPSSANYTAVIGAFSGDTYRIRVNNGGTSYITVGWVQVYMEYTKTTD